MARTGRTVVVAEGSDGLRRLELQVLADGGFTPLGAGDGLEAIDRVFEHQPDLLVLDLLLPEFDAWQILASVREMALPPRVLITSTLDDYATFRSVIAQGATAFLPKPFDPWGLLMTCSQALRSGAMEAAPDDRRCEVRRPLASVVHLKSRSLATPASMLDLSAAGSRLETSAALRLGEKVQLAFPLAGSPPLSAEVLWANTGAAIPEYGVRFHELREDERVELEALRGRSGNA